MGNNNLINARREKNDEFYTQYETVEGEVGHYWEHLRDKVVYCNCDDPRWSNFVKYFVENFHKIGLKKLIASHYVDQSYNLFTINDRVDKPVMMEYDGWLVDGRDPKLSELEFSEMAGDGDFRSEKSVELLSGADVVVTNPPFSLFRDFIAQIVEYDKKFLVIGNSNAIAYKDIFPLIKDSKMWMGVDRGAMTFELPGDTSSASYSTNEEDGGKEQTLGNVVWWTNLEHHKRYEGVILFGEYEGNEELYPKYDNYDAINIDKVADIPMDYEEAMGVPISFIGQWNPEQFEVLGVTHSWSESGLHNGKLAAKIPVVGGKNLYARILIRRVDK